MPSYYEMHTTKTSKAMGNNQNPYRIFDVTTVTFSSLKKCNEFLKSEYGNCKRSSVYRDLPDNEYEKVGHIYCFKDEDWSHSPVEKWWQRDWVEIFHIQSTNVKSSEFAVIYNQK